MEWYTLSLWLLKIYEGYIIQYAELDESQAGIKIPGRIISSHRYEDDTSLMAESKEEIKSLLMRKGDAKSGLELNIQKTIHKIILNIHGIQSHNSWHIDEGKVETVTDFLFLGSKITMNLYCSHKIKRHLLLGRKYGYEKPEQCNKSRDSLFYRSL